MSARTSVPSSSMLTRPWLLLSKRAKISLISFDDRLPASLKNKNKANVAKALRVNPYFVGDYDTAARNYPMRKVSQIIGLLRDGDVKSKGVGAGSASHGDLLKELLFKILH